MNPLPKITMTHHSQRQPAAKRTAAFTLIELMVVLVIIALLSSLTLAGLAGVRQRTKIDKTKSTIRKLHDVIMPQYESYLRRRVPGARTGSGPLPSSPPPFSVYVDTSSDPVEYFGPAAPSGYWAGPFTALTLKKPARVLAESRLQMLRVLMIYELPDAWADVPDNPLTLVTAGRPTPDYAQSGRVRAYAAYKSALPQPLNEANTSAECLFMIVARGGLEPDVMEQFRPDEIGDFDRDQAPEFHDAWGQPIVFSRWAPGISEGLTPPAPQPSMIQVADPDTRHDPLDPLRVDSTGYALTPLIYSGGGNLTNGLRVTPDDPAIPSGGWSPLVTTGSNGLALLSITTPRPGIDYLVGSLDTPNNATEATVRDNLTNHDFLTK